MTDEKRIDFSFAPDRLDVERGICTACGHETTLRNLWTYTTGVRCITSEPCELRAELRDEIALRENAVRAATECAASLAALREAVGGVALRMRIANNGTVTWDEAIDSWERVLRAAVRP